MIFLFFREYKYTRVIAAAVVQHLQYRGFDAALVTPEEYDVSLRASTERVNTWCQQLGNRNVCLVSIHTNAAGNGKQWMNARGWACYTSRGQTAGDHLADCLYRRCALATGSQAPEGLLRRRSRLGKRLLHLEEYALRSSPDGESFPRQLRRLPLPGIRRRPPGNCRPAR